ncbi:type I pantothenate kinase [Lactobacillus mulieris]|uniref:type I pantothenate kinase n=1 Tax=Lactobacillus mulieris TaxID=2508708 RepID=UPI001432E541|nr:type I pantothenate kinase [Lactobacillus mulieris]MCF1784185.1 type I pantothenate kinase [Lactobacillus mulieris]MCW8104976.1 type I pantothenate kinase [Lactobacillus mulieris]MDK6803971.1 type I pantothenate kinase [Lactobacillus mulieris]MDK8383099.1 type I pantothenate kinase [Lactobacillus mulieris]MDT9621292.1 type I pantothenate kinase [Lactobacillus mulieris]
MKSFTHFSRKEWASLNPNLNINVSHEELEKINSHGDVLSIKDVRQVYESLVAYIGVVFEQSKEKEKKKADFLKRPISKRPFIIGISGSVSVGKSTTSRLLRLLLQRTYPELKIQRMTTDGFLYTNNELRAKNLMSRKGFPESYNMQRLNDFLTDVVRGKEDIVYPLYSQGISDIVPDEFGHVLSPDILIIEGINTLQLPPNGTIVSSDFYDLSIYLDADEDLIESWFLSRFKELMEQNKDNPDNYYYHWANSDRTKAINAAKEVWQSVNLVNLREFIAPTKARANVVLHKTKGHHIDSVYLRCY